MSANTTTWRERLASPLTWHYAGFAVLLVTVTALATRFALDWAAISSRTQDTILDRQVQMHALRIQTEPLQGLDKRLDATRDQIQDFDSKRIPSSYSVIAGQIGTLAVASGVRLTNARYAQRAPVNDLSEIVIDAGITGEYPQIVKFINSLERDKIFFNITGMSLTGQQAGAVALRLEFSTWLRPADAAASGLPPAEENSSAAARAPAATPAQEGQPR